jgi:hypothetical protein
MLSLNRFPSSEANAKVEKNSVAQNKIFKKDV